MLQILRIFALGSGLSSTEDRGRCQEGFPTHFKPELDKSDEFRNFSMLIHFYVKSINHVDC